MCKPWTWQTVSRFRSFGSNISGVVAIEFALIAPLLMVMTFGTFEIARALLVHKRFQKATAMVADLVSRENQLWSEDDSNDSISTGDAITASKATLTGMMTSVEQAMEPYSTAPLDLRVYQVWASMTDPTQTKIEWSYQYRSQVSTGCGQTKTLDTGVLPDGGRAIIVDAQYQYTPLLGNLLPSVIRQMTWSDTMIMLPRNTPSVLFVPALNNNNTWSNPSTVACSMG